MSKIGNRNIGSIYVSHVRLSHEIFIDLSMLYMYEMDYIKKSSVDGNLSSNRRHRGFLLTFFCKGGGGEWYPFREGIEEAD